jgi:hypothetical protein
LISRGTAKEDNIQERNRKSNIARCQLYGKRPCQSKKLLSYNLMTDSGSLKDEARSVYGLYDLIFHAIISDIMNRRFSLAFVTIDNEEGEDEEGMKT